MGRERAGTSPTARPRHRRGLAVPRGDVFGPSLAQRQLPVRATPVCGSVRPGWLFLAAHGGAGATLLAQLSAQPSPVTAATARRSGDPVIDFPPFALSTDRAWPNPNLESWPTPPVVVVAQTTMRGLGWARDAAAQYLTGQAPDGVRVIGLVTIADQPGRLPQPIGAARSLLDGAYPRTWQIPYINDYRLLAGLPGEPAPLLHPAVDDVLSAIRTAISTTITLPEGTS